MSRYLMTHSLLSSWLYAIKDNPYETADDEGEEKLSKYDEFLLTLKRVPTPINENIQKGIDLENLVTEIINGRGDPRHRWHESASEIAETIKGGVLQHRAQKQIEVRGVTLLLYGRIDALKAGVVYDVKYSGKYEVGKYFDSTQHPVYLELVPGAREFTYLASNGSNVWPETYTREDTPSVYPIISDFIDWLDTRELMAIYKEKWLAL